MQTTVHTGLDAGANAGVEIVKLKVRDQSFDCFGCHFPTVLFPGHWGEVVSILKKKSGQSLQNYWTAHKIE